MSVINPFLRGIVLLKLINWACRLKSTAKSIYTLLYNVRIMIFMSSLFYHWNYRKETMFGNISEMYACERYV